MDSGEEEDEEEDDDDDEKKRRRGEEVQILPAGGLKEWGKKIPVGDISYITGTYLPTYLT